MQLPLDAVGTSEAQARPGQAERMLVELFRDLDPFVSVRVGLVEHAALGEGARQAFTGLHRGKDQEAEPLAGPLALERLHQSPTGVFGPAIVAREVTRLEQVVMGCDLERQVPEGLANGSDPLRERARVGDVAARGQAGATHVG